MSAGWDLGDEWITTRPAADFIGRIQAIREGERPVTEKSERPYPANAIRALHDFALKRPIGELVEFTKTFHERDAVTVLTAAALYRAINQAADLAIKQWDAENAANETKATTRIADIIIHDIACQRTVPDVAAFVRECRHKGRHELVNETLRVFTEANSGRKSDDKAQLYIILRDEGCEEEAAKLLHKTLTAIGDDSAQDSGAAPAKFYGDLVGALYHFSPTERIVEEWVDAQLDPSKSVVHETREIVARLIAYQKDGPDTLAEYVGKRLIRWHVVNICELLAREAPEKCTVVRRHVAARGDVADLAYIVTNWQKNPTLRKTTRDLLADIVARETKSGVERRSRQELEGFSRALRDNHDDDECTRLLWIAAAEHAVDRPGAELAALLKKVERRRDRHRVAQAIAHRLATDVLENGRDERRLVDYLKELRATGIANAVFVTLKELADPASTRRTGNGWGEAIATIATDLYDEGAEGDGWDLLERFLENEQRVLPQDVAVIVDRLRMSKMPDHDRLLLLRETVGPWSDAGRREEAVAELRRRGFHDEAAQVVRSLR